jgi:hypothetical protein
MTKTQSQGDTARDGTPLLDFLGLVHQHLGAEPLQLFVADRPAGDWRTAIASPSDPKDAAITFA